MKPHDPSLLSHRVRWVDPETGDERYMKADRETAIVRAGELVREGLLMVVIYDETFALITDQDRAAEAVGIPA